MSAIVVRPTTITDGILVSTDAVETVALWDAGTIYLADDEARDDTTHRIYQSQIGADMGEVAISQASPGVVTKVAHGLSDGTKVAFTTTGALPTGLSPSTIYYVVNRTDDTFEVSATEGGPAIDTTSAGSGTHTGYSNPNLGYDPTDAENTGTGLSWIDLRPTNAWAMFDQVNGTATELPDDGEVVLAFPSRVDSMGLQGLAGLSNVQVVVNDGTGDVYDETFPLAALDGIDNWYSWFFEERINRESLLIADLPAVQAPTITVTFDGSAPSVGTLVVGRQLDIGDPQYGLGLGIIDYSRKETDDFGNYLVVERGFSKKADVTLFIPNERVNIVHRTLSDFRATPLLWGLTDQFDAANVFGFYRDFNIEIAYPNHSLCTVQIEGVT